MKVAHITTVHPANDNRIYHKECVTLMKAGYEVFLIAAGIKSRKIQNINLVGYSKEKKRIKRIFKTSLFDLIKICKKVNADIYHFHDPEVIITGLYLKLIGKKVIYDIHENYPAAILNKNYIKYEWLRVLISKIFRLFEKISIKFFDAIVCARPDISKEHNHKRLITLRNFPILKNLDNLKKKNIKKEKKSVIYVGLMTENRGINQLIDSFEKFENCELWLLGPIFEKKLKKKILSKPKNIRYFGVVQPKEIFSYIFKADIGIITFLNLPNHTSTLATKPFEYMACGKPMIMSNFSYWKKTFNDSSLYVRPNDINDISKKVQYLLSNNELRKKNVKKKFNFIHK
jgi:glycosyltransferase involved in cell wall biosynthesis